MCVPIFPLCANDLERRVLVDRVKGKTKSEGFLPCSLQRALGKKCLGTALQLPGGRHVEANPGSSVVRQGEGPTPDPLRVSVPTRKIGVGGTGVCVTEMSLEAG